MMLTYSGIRECECTSSLFTVIGFLIRVLNNVIIWISEPIRKRRTKKKKAVGRWQTTLRC